MKELTKAEEQVMQYIWKLEKCFLKDIVESFPEPKPAYTTISSVIRVLTKKGFIGYNTYGKTNEYYAKLTKSEYSKKRFRNMVSNYFNGSITSFASFFTSDKDLNIDELEEIKNIVDQKIKEKKDGYNKQ
jgi:predicted transcriptional regulator